MVRVRFMVR